MRGNEKGEKDVSKDCSWKHKGFSESWWLAPKLPGHPGNRGYLVKSSVLQSAVWVDFNICMQAESRRRQSI